MYTYKCKILNVVDGDTIDIEIDLGFSISIKERVRLQGVNTPEVYGKKAATEGEEGRSASSVTKRWFEDRTTGHFIYESIKYDAKDKYGRALGYIVWVDGNMRESLNESLIQRGWKM